MFTSKSLETLFSEEYKVSAEADRMGIRLSGAALKCKSTPDIISDGIAFGAVQVPKNGQPIILAADRQTTGGYAKPITVITADLPLLAQAKPETQFASSRFLLPRPKPRQRKNSVFLKT